ncbi:hypothetical protein ONE63_008562 [Megalurothrips usitatus]|uniref:Gamma-tubulin complex component n=1 Tax=Megalurothrips usitatus TaxID=439358 RepID=A0AAV7XRC8_9NEOP|nr:hypothetical protein ONE63_008562 [Megalurothrips usitatus]
MSLKLKDIILNDVQALIKSLTGFEENQENFKACERFILSNLLYHRYMSVDGHAVRRSTEGMVMKFQVHGLFQRGQDLDSLVKQFIACPDFKDFSTVDIQWSLLSLLLNLSQNPTNILKTVDNISLSGNSFNTENDDEFDWTSYLKEGEEEFFDNYDDQSSDEDEVDHMHVQENEPSVSLPSLNVKNTPYAPTVSLETQEPQALLSSNRTNTLKPSMSLKPSMGLYAQNVLASEHWLKNNVQHGWWSKAHVNEKLLSDHPFSKTAQLINPAAKDRIKNSTLSEHKIVLEIIWLLSAPCDTAVFVRVISDDGLKTHFCVRPHVTTPSLIPDVFSSFMSSVCACADMIEELQTFSAELHNSNGQKKVCSTYLAYSSALQYELKPLFETLSQLEQEAHKQEEPLTLLILKERLNPFLATVESLYRLHKAAVLDWKKNSNWLCAIHLLSVILSSLRNTEEDVSMNFRIFVHTFRVYIKIIDQWLTGGQLYDTHDEFFIKRMGKRNSSLGASFEKRDWEKELKTLGIETPRALQVLAHCLLKAAQPLHVLCELNRLPELQKHTSSRCGLHLFLQNVICYLEAASYAIPMCHEVKVQEEKYLWWKKLDHLITDDETSETKFLSSTITDHKMPIDVKAVMSHLHRLEEPLLVKDFQTLFCDSKDVSSSSSENVKNETNLLLNKVLLLSHSVVEHVPLESCIEKAVLCLTADWDGIAGALVADILVQERQLLYHMHTTQSVFLLQAYYKLHPFLSHIFKLILHRGNMMWMNSHTLSVLLQDCMDSDQFKFSVNVVEKDPNAMNALECIDCMVIEYQVEWPLCAIIDEKSQTAYNSILRLLLKIRWGLWLVEDLDVSDFKGQDSSEVSQRLLHLRYWLLHVMRGTYNFIAGHVLNGPWLKFEEDMKSCRDMHAIIEVHGRFLDGAVRQSLYASQPDPIKNALFQLVVLAENLCTLWNIGLSKVPLSKLKNIETCYSQCHRFLAASLHSLAEEEGLQHLVMLSNLFNWSIPKEAM